jgi:hypothetical protein
MSEAILNPIAFATLLTSLYVLRFRGWDRPYRVALYFGFFAAIELVAAHWLLPRDAFGVGLGYLCLALTVPVLVAVVLVRRHELRQGETGD